MFGKKENFRLDKLREGFTLKLKNTVYKIIEIGEYDWNGDGRSIEYIIKSKDNNEQAFLEVEFFKGDFEIYFSKAVFVDIEILKDALKTQEIVFQGHQFFLEEHYKGAYKNLTNRASWKSLSSYMFFNNKRKNLTIEHWEDNTYEVFYGEKIKTKNIKNITPKPLNERI